MPEGKHLGAELGVGAGADEHEIGDEAYELVGEAKKHGDGSCPITPTIRAGEGASTSSPPRPEGAPSELTVRVLLHTCGGGQVDLPAARLYLIDQGGKFASEQVIFY